MLRAKFSAFKIYLVYAVGEAHDAELISAVVHPQNMPQFV